VQFADNSVDAEHFARQMSFDVLLVDNRIPGRRGLDLISI
jgi:YesN/AraC family two-component response regulator